MGISGQNPAPNALDVSRNTDIVLTLDNLKLTAGIPDTARIWVNYEATPSTGTPSQEKWRSVGGDTPMNGWSGSRSGSQFTLTAPSTPRFRNFAQVYVRAVWTDNALATQDVTYHFWIIDDASPAFTAIQPLQNVTTDDTIKAQPFSCGFTDQGDLLGAGGSLGSGVSKAAINIWLAYQTEDYEQICINGVFQGDYAAGSSIDGGADGDPLADPGRSGPIWAHATDRNIYIDRTGDWPPGSYFIWIELQDLNPGAAGPQPADPEADAGARVWEFDMYPPTPTCGLTSPTADAVDVPASPGTLTVYFDDAVTGGVGVNAASLQVEVDFGDVIAGEDAMVDGAFATGWSGSITPTVDAPFGEHSHYAVTLTRAGGFVYDPDNPTVTVRLSARNTTYTPTTGTLEASFSLAPTTHPHAAPEIASHCEVGKGRMLEQFKGKPNIEAVICAFGDRAQEVEQACADILAYRSLETALGAQLDRLGENIGLEREGRGDTIYRSRLRAQAAVIASHGHPDELLEILLALDDGFMPAAITLTEHFAAALVMTSLIHAGDYDLGEEQGRYLRRAKAAAVRLILHFEEVGIDLFEWFDSPTGAGWEDLDSPGTGGTWSYAV